MSSAADDAGVEDGVPVEKAPAAAPRRFPPPCWTQEETVVLIEAYRERWYSLRRGYLRTPDWDAVAATVADRCPGATPTKTSAQCRHKMEKLRQRFRAEKQRAASFPYPGGRYFSSWFFYENMEAMENGTAPPPARSVQDSPDGSRLQSFIDQNILKLKLKAGNSTDSVPDSGIDQNFLKSSKRFNFPGEYPPYLNKEPPVTGIPQPPLKPPTKTKKSVTGKIFPNFHEIHRPEFLPPNPNHEFWVKLPNATPPTITNYTSASKFTPNTYPNMDSGSKRGRNGVEEIVASIKLLGEGFMRMEKAKMEMAREMEGMRMEMEMKRNEMVLESQKQIVDAFLKGLIEVKMKKNKKVKKTADSSSGQP